MTPPRNTNGTINGLASHAVGYPQQALRRRLMPPNRRGMTPVMAPATWYKWPILLLTMLLPGCGSIFGLYDEPAHTVQHKDGDFEIRAYAPQLIAEVTVEAATRTEAANKGFRPLGAFIFGDNQARTTIDMTTPVLQEPHAQKIAMTAPVLQEADSAMAGHWVVRFVMPREFTKDTLPTPTNADIVIREQPARDMAAIRFSGRVSDALAVEKTQALRVWIEQQGRASAGAPQLAYYNEPWVLPFLRRNEVLLELKPRAE